MDKLFREIFNYKGIRYPIILMASALSFIGSVYYNSLYPDTKAAILWIIYGASITMAFIWSIINYVAQIKINSIYKKNDSITDYISSLNMDPNEKEELQTYLSDFVKDLIDNGKTEAEAVRYAIAQFQVEEFNSVTKSSNILSISSHLYLIGFTVLSLSISIVMFLLNVIFSSFNFWFLAIGWTSLLYAIAFMFLIFIYLFANKIITKMLERN